jgi:sugar lactone lactonase YvrE
MILVIWHYNLATMKNALWTMALAMMALAACQPAKKETVLKPTLTLKWETDTAMTTCESVLYDSQRQVLYVANINGDPSGKDGNGFVSTINLDGSINTLQWATGMDAPKGMGLFNNVLYVTDINRVHEIDVTTGKISKTHVIDSAKFLNDITVDGNGKVYVSDTGAGKVMIIENGTVAEWTAGLAGPNGLLADNGAMLVALWDQKTLNLMDMGTRQLTLKTDSIDNPDGIVALGDGTYLVSSWNGMIHHIDSDWNETLLLDTRTEKVSAADIEYIPSKKLVLVPTFFKNKVAAYEFSMQ